MAPQLGCGGQCGHIQVERTFSEVSGTIVGFQAPQSEQTTTVAGYHLHFIDDDRTVGGHVLDFALQAGRISIDLDAGLHVEMPASTDGADTAMTENAAEAPGTALRWRTGMAPILDP